MLRLTRRRMLHAAALLPFGFAGWAFMPSDKPKIPQIGFHVAAWETAENADHSLWEQAVHEMADLGLRRATFVTYRFVDRSTGVVAEKSRFDADSGATLEVLSAAMKAAESLGLDAAIYPIVEIDIDENPGHIWRGGLRLRKSLLPTFFDSYGRYLEEVTVLARDCGARRVYLGSELAGLTADPSASPYWAALIERMRTLFPQEQGRLIYAANYDEFRDVPFWSDVDEIGINAYFPLFRRREAEGEGAPSLDALSARWREKLSELKAFSQEHERPILFSEWGAVPFDLTTTQPWNHEPSDTPDPEEQLNAYRAILEAIQEQGSWLAGIDFWHWLLPGSVGSPFGIAANSPVGGLARTFAGR